MAFTALLLVWCAVCCLVEGSLRIPTQRYKDQYAHLRKRQFETSNAKLGPSLYWLGNWTVGATPNFRMLIDTGSSDCIIPKGRYKPYNETRFIGHQNFTIEYEGVNRAGFGFEKITGTLRADRVAQGNLSVPNQAIGEIDTNIFIGVPTPKNLNLSAGHGIIGFASKASSSFTPKALSWFHHLCHDKAISECRFGLAFGTNGTGEVVVGELDTKLIDGSLTTAAFVGREYTVMGDVALNGKVLFENQTIIMDVGTDNLQGPPGPVKQIFNMLNFQTVTLTGMKLPNSTLHTETILGYFPCDKPPSLGFAFPTKSELNSGETQRIFNVSTSTGIWDVYDHGNNNCTSVLGGTNFLTKAVFGAEAWLVGQPFFAGHYVDFNVDDQTVGYGDLKNPETVV